MSLLTRTLLAGLTLTLSVRAERLSVKTYTVAHGLASASIKLVVQDSVGFIWVCTAEGLSRYDGYQFTTYTTEHGLPEPHVVSFAQMGTGDYWVLTHRGVLCRFTSEGRGLPKVATFDKVEGVQGQGEAPERLFVPYSYEAGADTPWVDRLYTDSRGRLWAGHIDRLMLQDEANGRFHPTRLNLTIDKGLIVGGLAFAEDSRRDLWIAMRDGLVRQSTDGRITRYPLGTNERRFSIRSMLADDEDRIWIGFAGGGLVVFKPDSVETSSDRENHLVHHLSNQYPITIRDGDSLRLPHESKEVVWVVFPGDAQSNFVATMLRTSNGRTWVGTRKGLWVFDGHRLRFLGTDQGLAHNSIAALCEDRDRNLWIGTNNGLMKLPLDGFRIYDRADGLGDDDIQSLFEDQSGTLHVVSGHWILNQLRDGRFISSQPAFLHSMARIGGSQHSLLGLDGSWWFLTPQGLYSFRPPFASNAADGKNVRLYTSADGLPNNNIFRVYEDRKGDLWISTTEANALCVSRLDRRTGVIHTYAEESGVPTHNRPSAFCEDSLGNLWIGFTWGGLARYSDGKFTFFPKDDPGVPSETITGLFVDSKGRLWVASNFEGVMRIDSPMARSLEAVSYTTANGLSSNHIRCIDEDRWGRMYFGSTGGLDQLDPSTGYVRHYTTADGLAGDYVTSALRDRQGVLWFGTSQGLSRFDPGENAAHEPPRIRISQVKVNNGALLLPPLGTEDRSSLDLLYNQNHLHIEFFGLSFAPGVALHYQYMLEGSEDEWSTPSLSRAVDFANLPPGNYRFLVRATSTSGHASPIPASLGFTVHPPFWQTWWFRTLALLLFASAIYSLYRYRVMKLLELERMRTRIASDLHDDVGSMLTRIAVHSEVMQHDSSPDRITSSSQTIAAMSREVIRMFSDVVWSVDTHHDTFGDLLGRMKSFALDLLSPKDIAVEFVLSGIDQEKRIPSHVRQDIYLIFKEIINNITKHSTATRVRIRIQQTGHTFTLSVQDDGQGLPTGSSGDGHGLRNMKMRAERMKGLITFENDPGLHATLIVPGLKG